MHSENVFNNIGEADRISIVKAVTSHKIEYSTRRNSFLTEWMMM